MDEIVFDRETFGSLVQEHTVTFSSAGVQWNVVDVITRQKRIGLESQRVDPTPIRKDLQAMSNVVVDDLLGTIHGRFRAPQPSRRYARVRHVTNRRVGDGC